MVQISLEDFIKQDEESISALNGLFGSKLQLKGLEKTTINNSMNLFYEQGMYIIAFLAKDSDTRETLIIFDESEVIDYVNY